MTHATDTKLQLASARNRCPEQKHYQPSRGTYEYSYSQARFFFRRLFLFIILAELPSCIIRCYTPYVVNHRPACSTVYLSSGDQSILLPRVYGSMTRSPFMIHHQGQKPQQTARHL